MTTKTVSSAIIPFVAMVAIAGLFFSYFHFGPKMTGVAMAIGMIPVVVLMLIIGVRAQFKASEPTSPETSSDTPAA
jgi:hypothetical protein